ncbi:MAG: 30S ribosomal protein S12 methylthiotransferase RimO [Bacillota bacterium]|nr:30S ribosomal protein S12 methylthiotransferase RimO [Bacillota bacterium]
MAAEHGPSVYIETLGCAKNTVDSEYMAGILDRAGFRLVPEAARADVAVLETCGFIGPAREESLAALEALLEWKRRGRRRAVVVAGCLVQRDPSGLRQLYPEVDALLGSGDFPQVAEVLRQLLGGRGAGGEAVPLDRVGRPAYRYDALLPRRGAGGFSAYVKISEGCDHGCSFCAIPLMRGRFRSRPPEVIEEEVRGLVEAGAREVNLIAQDSTAYGLDRPGYPRLPELLRRLDRVEGLEWLRLHYAYPTLVDEALLETIARGRHILHYLDMPLQHASDRVLQAMRRPERRRLIEEKVELIRRRLPDVVLRSTFIVGFPGEGRADFEQLLDLLRTLELDRVGFFTYSREAGTPAAALHPQVPERVKESRLRRAERLQARISERRQSRLVGRLLEVWVEAQDAEDPRYWVGRWWGQAPEVDGNVVFAATRPHRPGDRVRVRIERAEAADLLGSEIA